MAPGVAVVTIAPMLTPVAPPVLDLLIACLRQMEQDAVMRDEVDGWCRSLDRLIAQDAMPAAWDAVVAYLRGRGYAV